jgi:oxygen-independent coproporphyrinogen-3 oxidase
MGLRLAEGVDAGAIADRFSLSTVVDWPRADRLVQSGHLTREGTRVALTASGRLLLDHILGEIAATDVRALAVA